MPDINWRVRISLIDITYKFFQKCQLWFLIFLMSRSNLYINGSKIVAIDVSDSSEGKHYMCRLLALDPAFHTIYIEGYSSSTRTFLMATYAGADTLSQVAAILPSVPPDSTGSQSGQLNFKECDPHPGGSSSNSFTICVFAAHPSVDLESVNDVSYYYAKVPCTFLRSVKILH